MPEIKPRIFISHAWEDKPIVHEIEKALKAAGADVWVDHSELRGGQNLPKRISDALGWCNTLLLVWSDAAKNSHWVELEWSNAVSLEKVIIPCMAEKTPLPPILASTLFLEFRDLQKGLADLLRALNLAKAKKSVTGSAPAQRLARVIHSQIEEELPAVKIKPPQAAPSLVLRATATQLTETDVKQLIEKYDFYCGEYNWTKEYKNPNGKGIAHQFEKQQNGKVVFDAITGLMWQQSGSGETMTYADAQKYVEQRNRESFAGFSDWRLPTLEEAMSLMEPKESSNGLFIDAVFDAKQRYIWTADKAASGAWPVDFGSGNCGWNTLNSLTYVRVVR